MKNVTDIARLFRDKIDVGSYGCLKLWIFKNQGNENLVTVLSDWINETSFHKFEKSEVYYSFKNARETDTNINYDLLGFKDSLVYSNEVSELFSISRSYVKNFNETLKMFREVYTQEEAIKLGILSIQLYCVITNEKLVIALVKWKNAASHDKFVGNKPTPDDVSMGEYGTDRYGLMDLVDSWSTGVTSKIKEN